MAGGAGSMATGGTMTLDFAFFARGADVTSGVN